MSNVMSGIVGISLGVIILVGIQTACYKLIAYENYHKAVVIALVSVILGILATLLIVSIAK
ncbi:hypothetical protein LCGC14_2448700 [marine sediment metagenome]|uniref:Uncharacterized protein n=1 Tax=marine sediment metagenome TaxID=412755 RepID=A0A0F9C4B7_9ZZZZ